MFPHIRTLRLIPLSVTAAPTAPTAPAPPPAAPTPPTAPTAGPGVPASGNGLMFPAANFQRGCDIVAYGHLWGDGNVVNASTLQRPAKLR